MSVIWQNNEWYGQGGGGGGDVTGRAKSTSIAPVFDETASYAAGDRVTYEDELYVFNKAHTGTWDAADADKTDIDTLTERMPSTDMSEVASPMPSVMSRLPVLFDESGTEQVVGWYKYADGTKKPLYQKTISAIINSLDQDVPHGISNFSQCVSVHAVTGPSTVGVLGQMRLIPGTYRESGWSVGLVVNAQYVVLQLDSAFLDRYKNNLVYITLQYTKTTDTPQ